MNFKPNVWTLLFVLALGALLYQMNMKKDEVTTTKKESKNSSDSNICEIFEMPADSFFIDFGHYITYANFMKNLFEQGANACDGFREQFEYYASLINPDVWRFQIPKCEMRTMLDLNPDGEYFAYLIMKTPKADSMVIDLAFSHQMIQGGPGAVSMDKTLAAKGMLDPKDGFFDFTTPCPPVCDTAKEGSIKY